MGKKRGKDKSSREDDGIDLAGKDYIIFTLTTCGTPKVSFIHYFFILTGPSCRHIKKGTDQTLLKKLYENSDWTRCQDCQHEENKENISATLPQESEEEVETAPVWMCLKCGHRVSLVVPFIIHILIQSDSDILLLESDSDILLNYEMHLFLQGLWTKLREPACHQTLWDTTFRSTLPGGQFRQLECVVSVLLLWVIPTGKHVFEMRSSCFHMFLTPQVLHMWWWSPVLQDWTFGSAVDQLEKTNLCWSNKETAEK